ncbi:MAG: hypothetical protein JSU65_12620 [Candidatus Zixiibacteriota bacterium]|nr:MAG: hypothetical protein JSU65_12620 [candidate division Zixibacteria bacterium]
MRPALPLATILLLLMPPSIARAAELRLTANVGYDLISQEFFADSLTGAGADSSVVEWQLRKNYLDDLRASFSAQYFPFDDRRVELRPSYEQSQEFQRIRMNTNLRLPVKGSRFDLITELEMKRRYRNTASVGDNYLLGTLRTRFTTPLSTSTKGWAQLRGDFVSFDSTSDYIYSYQRGGAAIGLSHSIRDYTFVDVELFVNSLTAPDSSQLDYVNPGLSASFMNIGRRGSFDLYFRAENRDYNQPNEEDDHFRVNLQLRNKFETSDKTYMRQEADIELVRHAPADLTHFSYSIFRAEAVFGLTIGNSQIGLGPAVGFLSDGSTVMGGSQEYKEISLKGELDYLHVGRLFLSVESFTGRRNYGTDSEFQSDFTFERISLIGDLQIARGISYNLLYSTEWEWHDSGYDDSHIDLLSTSLSYAF